MNKKTRGIRICCVPMCVREGRILLVECKTGQSPYLPPKQLNHIMEISKKIEATPILAVRKKHQRIRWFMAEEEGLEETETRNLT